jgi:predicted DNA binding CopG/RHH family protein
MPNSKNQKNVKLDKYEADLEENVSKNIEIDQKEKEKHLFALKNAANNYTKKNKRINIRVYSSDLEQIKRIAMDEGLPYQTLITSILHKFATGRLSSLRDEGSV